MRVIAQPDDGLAFERIVNLPKRGLGPATLQTLHQLARAEGISLTAAASRLVETDEIKPKARQTLSKLLDDFGRWREKVDAKPLPELAVQVLDECGYTAMWRASNAIDAPGRLDNLKELIVALEDFQNLGEFLEHVSLVMENDDPAIADKVNLMTLHGAKGLEFDTVFLAGWEEELFPHPRTLDDSGTAGLEEERRLAYVGLTRARKRAIVSFAANRRVHGRWQSAPPSRFIDELPAEHIDIRSQPGLYGSGGTPGAGLGFSDTPAVFNAAGRRPRRRQRGGGVIEDAPFQALPGEDAPREDNGGGVKVGERVFHRKFGYGQIVAIDGGKLEIAFEKAGGKKVMASFVEAV